MFIHKKHINPNPMKFPFASKCGKSVKRKLSILAEISSNLWIRCLKAVRLRQSTAVIEPKFMSEWKAEQTIQIAGLAKSKTEASQGLSDKELKVLERLECKICMSTHILNMITTVCGGHMCISCMNELCNSVIFPETTTYPRAELFMMPYNREIFDSIHCPFCQKFLDLKQFYSEHCLPQDVSLESEILMKNPEFAKNPITAATHCMTC